MHWLLLVDQVRPRMIKYCAFCGAVNDVAKEICEVCESIDEQFYTLDEVIRMIIQKNSGIRE